MLRIANLPIKIYQSNNAEYLHRIVYYQCIRIADYRLKYKISEINMIYAFEVRNAALQQYFKIFSKTCINYEINIVIFYTLR